ncbi:MAG: FAD-binding protein, partial [Candidatus Bathyarchaeia archaeon]
EEWLEQFNTVGEYINNRIWNKIFLEESYSRFLDLLRWGVKFYEKNGEPVRGPNPHGSPNEFVFWGMDDRQHGLDRGLALRKAVEKSGAQIIDRVMITDLIKNGDTIVGAVGVPLDTYDLYIFKAKAIVVCAGASGLKSAGWPNHDLTGDGEAIQYRVGAEITGKEFNHTCFTSTQYPYYGTWPRPLTGRLHYEGLLRLVENRKKCGSVFEFRDAEGKLIPIQGKGWMMNLELEWAAHDGRGPLCVIQRAKEIVVGGAAVGMSHATAGAVPSDTTCAIRGLKGLYAAGDSLGAMHCGAHYSGFGFALAFAAVSGARAGVGAAEYALKAEKSTFDEEELKRIKEIAQVPLKRKGGFNPRWVASLIQHYMIPYYILMIKSKERLEATLKLIEFVRDHLVPKLKANNPHELRLVHETKNMVLISEMMLRASLFRTESRGFHYREDYPRRDDPTWLAWVMLKEESGRMKVSKEPIPKEWWPDLSKPYQERYPVRFPGE